MLTGRLLRPDDGEHDLARRAAPLHRALERAGVAPGGDRGDAHPRPASSSSGRTIEEALERARAAERQGYRHSFDMLGEAARTTPDAERYRAAYERAIAAIGGRPAAAPSRRRPASRSSCRRCTRATRWRSATACMRELLPALLDLARQAREAGIGFTIDAEEADRLDLSLDLIEALALAPELAGWDGLGLAVQAYQKRALPLIDWLADLAGAGGRRLMVRLVKGAYWDSEIKRAQERGLDAYPVFTRKVATDVSYLACAKRMLAAGAAFYPQFATHNAHTVAAILELAGDRADWEFQRLHGMGEALYDESSARTSSTGRAGSMRRSAATRTCSPIWCGGCSKTAPTPRSSTASSTSAQPIDEIVADPIARLARLPAQAASAHPAAARPVPAGAAQFARARPRRPARAGRVARGPCRGAAPAVAAPAPIIGGVELTGAGEPVFDPERPPAAARRGRRGDAAGCDRARRSPAPQRRAGVGCAPGGERAAMLERAADRFEAASAELMALIIREGGRTIPAALSEVREAVRFPALLRGPRPRRFRRARAAARPDRRAQRDRAARPRRLRLHLAVEFPAGDLHRPDRRGARRRQRGVAKPAEQTPLVAAAAVRHLLAAGIPGDVLHLLPGDGEAVGGALVARPAHRRRRLYRLDRDRARDQPRAGRRAGPIVPLIAETGGQNAMIVDSSALAEQVVADVADLRLRQRRAALLGAAPALCAGGHRRPGPGDADRRDGGTAIGDPALLATDVGPVIDEAAREALERHAARMAREGRLLYRCAAAARHRARHLLRAARLRDRQRGAARRARCSARSCMSCAGTPTGSTRCSTRSPRPATG